MGKKSNAPWPPGVWRNELADVVTDVEELLQLLDLGDRPPSTIPSALRRFPLRIPRAFVDRMSPGDPDDPLLRQVLPVSGAAHFEVSDDETIGHHAELAARLPGYLVPRLVREVPGAPPRRLASICGVEATK